MQDVIELDIKDIRLVGSDVRIVATPKLKQK
jgi:diaminohydroxyphosphoribosylaminopyrimidine deaminase/5-amino-6-(5-phosphoribosylamino)uracil reductase